MPRRLEERLAAIHELAGDPHGPAAVAALRDALRSKTGLLVAAAASVAAEADIGDLVDELPAAFERLLERPVERDPGCRGKVAIARALHRLERWEEGVFPRGARHVQREPVWGGSEDTAAELRGVCGLAYAQLGRADALDVLADLLADPERMARVAAAQALGDAGRPDAAALLRYKALIGDDEPAVLAACFASLLALSGEVALSFVARFLDGKRSERSEVAALAMGESRLAAAYPLLRRFCGDSLPSLRAEVGYLALALLRLDAATDHLVEVVGAAEPADAIAAARALATFRDDAALAARVRAAADAHPSPDVAAAARAAFAPR
ncbi:MAG TPA: HEAT repeat domain-containing protein [Kofleriaceae bacterium]|nr:HEAT repeat domain-containing protein [Kofleriaceae bacterium]